MSQEPSQQDLEQVEKLRTAYTSMKEEIKKVIVGQEHVVDELFMALFCRGHCLLIGVPGLAKTLLISTLSRVLSLDETWSGEDGGTTMGATLPDLMSVDPDSTADQREQLERLTRAIAELPDNDRHVVVLYYHEQLYLKEIGKILGVTESRVSQILTRAVERLRLKLKEQE